MTAPTVLRSTRPSRLRRVVGSDLFAFSLAALAAIAVAALFLRPPATVDRVSLDNPSRFDIRVEVRGPDGGWMALATAGSDTTTTTSEVIDQGPSWTFRFSAQGRSGGEVRVTRGELEASNWTVVISDEVMDTLSRAGAPVPP